MTIVKIAEMAGTSIATVSRVINKDARVKEETRKRIQGIIDETGFVPNSLGRNLRTNRSSKILCILPTIATPAYAELLVGLTRKANERDYSVMFMVTDRNGENEKKYLRLIENRNFDGVILVATTLDDATVSEKARTYPVVSCNTKVANQSACYVSIDNREAACNTTKHLLDLGHRRIAVIKFSQDIKNQNEREKGFMDAMREAGCPVEPDEVLYDDEKHNLYGQLETVFAKPEPPTAVLSFGDISALAVLRFAEEKGMKIGKDLDVIGFGNVPFSAYGPVSLTRVSIPWFEIGETAFELVYEQISNPALCPRGIILPYTFVQGNTTRTQGPNDLP